MTDENCGGCWRCREEAGAFLNLMIGCPLSGNKRCPKANDHRHDCTASNEPGQPGSAYEHGSGAASARRWGL